MTNDSWLLKICVKLCRKQAYRYFRTFRARFSTKDHATAMSFSVCRGLRPAFTGGFVVSEVSFSEYGKIA
jgi:hypothetical protein